MHSCFNLPKNRALTLVLKCVISSLLPVCPFFLLSDSCARWSLCLRSARIYELPYSSPRLVTGPGRINEVTAWAKKRKQQTVKWMEQKRLPSRKSFYEQVPTEGLLCTTARDRPDTTLKILTIRDVCVTKTTATYPLLQIIRDLCPQVAFPHAALQKWLA